MAKSLPITATTTLLLPVRNNILKGLSLCAAAANSVLEVFDGVIGTIATESVTSGGTGYVIGDSVTLEQAGGGSQASYTVATVDGLVGEILTGSVGAAGTGYIIGDTLTLVQAGGGVQAVFTVATVGGAGEVTSITLVSGGSGYTDLGTYATTTDSALGAGATITASSVAEGVALTITLVSGGTGYTAGALYSTTSDGAGTGITITASTVTDAGVSIAKLAAVANESAPPVALPRGGILSTLGVSVRLTGASAKANLLYE